MVYTVRVLENTDTDARGNDLLAEIKKTLKINDIYKIRTAKVYRLEGISTNDVQKITSHVLHDPISQKASKRKVFKHAQQTVQVAYKPGVMNPETASILKCAKDLGIKLKAADSAWEYGFYGKINKNQINKIIDRLLVNKTIEAVVKSTPKTLTIGGYSLKTKVVPIRNLTDKELMKISEGQLFLNLDEMKIIQNYFTKIKRDPTDCEIEIIAQTWSEHCVHKTFKADLKINGKVKRPLIERIKSTMKNNPKIIISAFDDNSGVIKFYDQWCLNAKVETHNSPSAIEPYGGAMTGSGGVFRDILGTGQGAKPISSTDIFCFAPPNLQDSMIPPGCLSPTYLLRKVVTGVKDYGNRVGIPTNNGSIHFHPDFRAKPTVAVGSFGLLPAKYANKKDPKPNDLIVSVGGATGRDGIHGATFSSGEMNSKTKELSGSAVQIGNPIEEKRMIDAILKLRDENLIRTITDCGAGGYSSAVGEMGKKTGAEVNLDKVALKYQGLAPWEIFLSESQERMVLAIDPKKLKATAKILALFNVSYAVIGKFTNNKRLVVKSKQKIVADLNMKFLHDGLPQRLMIGTTKKIKTSIKHPKKPNNYKKIITKIISHPNICSKEPIIRQYDHNVQGRTVTHPFGGVKHDAPNDGSVLAPIFGKKYGVVIAHGINPTMNATDTYAGSIWALTEAVSNFVALGGNIENAALVDNFIWPFPDEESLADLDKSVDACVDFANNLKLPFVSGKDSLSSTYRYPHGTILKIPPVLLISVFGGIPDITKTVTSDFKKINSTITLIGRSDYKNLGGTVYFETTKSVSQNCPKVDLTTLPDVLSAITSSIKSGKALSVHDISEGGLVTAVSEMCFGGDCGALINLSMINKKNRDDFVLFAETPGTFLVETENEQIAKKLFSHVPHKIIGKTQSKQLLDIKSNSKTITSLPLTKLKKVWQRPMKRIFNEA